MLFQREMGRKSTQIPTPNRRLSASHFRPFAGLQCRHKHASFARTDHDRHPALADFPTDMHSDRQAAR
jgi:hypothetical protein